HNPGDPLPPPAQQRQSDPVDDPRPGPFEIVCQEYEGESGYGRFIDVVLFEPRGERASYHHVGKTRRNAEEEGSQRRSLKIGTKACREMAAPIRAGVRFQSVRSGGLARMAGFGNDPDACGTPPFE